MRRHTGTNSYMISEKKELNQCRSTTIKIPTDLILFRCDWLSIHLLELMLNIQFFEDKNKTKN